MSLIRTGEKLKKSLDFKMALWYTGAARAALLLHQFGA